MGLFGQTDSGSQIKNLGLENISVTDGDYSYCLGGLVGINTAGDINNCYSTGPVNAGDHSWLVGGLMGCNDANIIDCYSTGNVIGKGSLLDFGGLVGRNDANISNCYFLITSGPNNGLGKPLTDAQMKQQSSFVGWDFVNIWTMNGAISYPELAWQVVTVVPATPDLIITSPVSISPSPVTVGNNLTVTYTVKNNGSGNAAQTQTQIQVKPGSSTTTTTEISHTTPALTAGSSTTENVVVPIPSSVAAGTYTVYVILNYNHAIGQSNTSNDTYQTSTGALTIQAAAPPRLHVEGNKIKDPYGNIVVLRGVSMMDLGIQDTCVGAAQLP